MKKAFYMTRKVQLSLILTLISLTGGLPLQALERQDMINVETLPDDVAGCGCFAWPDKPFQTGTLIYQDVSVQDARHVNMKLNGKIHSFNPAAKSEKDKYFGNHAGDSFTESMVSDQYLIDSQWVITEIKRDPGDEAANSVFYNVIFTIKSHDEKSLVQKMNAKGYCGC